MNWYALALFAHIVGVLTLFSTLALQWFIMLRLRRASSVAQVREWSGLATGLNRLVSISGVLILGAGIYMTASAWSNLTSWIDVSLAAMGIMLILGMGVVGRRLKAIQRATNETTTDVIPAVLRAGIDDPTLWVSMQTSVAVALSIVFLMTNKPSLTVSIVAVIVSLALGALVGTLTLHPRQGARSAPLRVNKTSTS